MEIKKSTNSMNRLHWPGLSAIQVSLETNTWTWMRIDHCSTPMHLAKLRIRDSSVCEDGLEDGDLNHIFLPFPKLSPRFWCSSPN
ncbi:hypothetical protein EVAR_35496_1 [Eumeta japonica]|uniref:Uncharacterized protein n=1 Tax=Eumeta variegata TaxID=151549 RepID=A0A4C1X911_EUMVA|nr:hypothetical protein EVAR_35496_1 [Eumeta japonica]